MAAMTSSGQPEDYLPTLPGGVVCRAGGKAVGKAQAVVNTIDSRVCVEDQLGIQDRKKTFQESPWKNYFLVELYLKSDIHQCVDRGTAFLTDRDRIKNGTTYATFLTAGHVLFDYHRVVLKHSSELLKGGQPLEEVKPLIDLRKPHNMREGWFEVCPDFKDKDKDSGGRFDYGAIFVKKDYLTVLMDLRCMCTLNDLFSVPQSYSQRSEIFVAGYPVEWGNSGKGQSNDLVVAKGKYHPHRSLPANFIKTRSGKHINFPDGVDAHTADTSKGMSGSPVVLDVGSQRQVIAIHVGGAIIDGKTEVNGETYSWNNDPADFKNGLGVNMAVPINHKLLHALNL